MIAPFSIIAAAGSASVGETIETNASARHAVLSAKNMLNPMCGGEVWPNRAASLDRGSPLRGILLEQLECPQRAAGWNMREIGVAGLQRVHAADPASDRHILLAVPLPGHGVTNDA